MGDKIYPNPVRVTESDGVVRISYDQVAVDIPAAGPVPEGVPPLACRVFEAVQDLHRDSRAE
ncbi:hypothetical protein ACFW2V_13010 [Streptomyces sp. NPDC058947]|uniref:hypothetical protein n=1 Tax=Streptomyces sp. NPDC058947 TaxID=3346675 RepID=UPI0036C4D85D